MPALLKSLRTGGGSTSTEAAPTPINDAALVCRARDGDPWAEATLVRRHLGEVTGVVTRLLGSRHDAEEVAQDVFLTALRRLETLRKPEAFRGWVLRIAIYKTSKVLRRKRLLRTLGLDRSRPEATLDHLAVADAPLEVRTELAALDEVLGRMPSKLRIAWMMRYVEGHTIRDISRLCQCSVATTKRRVAAAHKRVLSAIDEEVIRRGW